MQTVLLVLLCVVVGCRFLTAFPMLPEIDDDYDVIKVNDSNGTAHDLYVIRTVVYEVGILTDADNETDSEADESFEEINFKFYDSKHNNTNTAFDFSKIPIPIETNFTGETITGITDGSFGILPFSFFNSTNSPKNFSFEGPIIPNYFIKELANFSTTDPRETQELIKNLPVNIDVN